jgi:anthranilate synthase component 1
MTVLKPSFEEFVTLSQSGNLVPVWTELAADYETPVSVFQKLSEGEDTVSFLLESAENSEQIGRYSFLGTRPRLEIRAKGRTLSVRERGETAFRTRELPESEGDPLHELERLMAGFKPVAVEGLPVFAGGAVGFLGYDMVRFFEPTVPSPPDEGLGLPDMAFVITETLVIFDHRFRKLQLVANLRTDDFPDAATAYAAARERIDGLIEQLRKPRTFSPFPLMTEPPESPVRSNTTREEYEGMVLKAKEYILAGDIFQVVPSQRFENDFTGRPIDLYRALRHVNPSPYMFCLQFGDEFALVGSSPEVHVQAIEGRIRIRPIAGTRWRGKTPEEDEALAADLLADPKERAEHVMLIDLARNDVGRVAEYGSVEVSEFMIVERYSHVMHIVSNVQGVLKDGEDMVSALAAGFPAGTTSGAPKIRAMEIITELEPHARGVYAGGVGYFGAGGDMDTCIALRTAVFKGGKIHVQAGGGVVFDSNPESEFQETIHKASALFRAAEEAARYDRGNR